MQHDRKKIIEELMQNMYAMRQKFMKCEHEPAITPAQGFVLRFVAMNQAANVKSISQALHITSSAATQLITGLVKKGYLLRKMSAKDKRAVSISISKKAQKLFEAFKKQRMEQMTKLFEALADDELAQYAALHKKLLS